MLSGLAKCHVCGLTLRCQASRSGNQYRYYRHTAVDRGKKCSVPGKMIRAQKLEEQWSEIVCRISLPKDWRHRIEELVGDADERAAILREQASIEEKLRRLAQLYRDMIIDDEEYTVARDSLQQRLSTLVVPDQQRMIKSAVYLQNLAKLWKVATPAEKRDISRVLIEKFEVDVVDETIVSIHPRRSFNILLRKMCGQRLVP